MRSLCTETVYPLPELPPQHQKIKKICYNTLEALDFVLNNNHGTILSKHDNHYEMGFNLTSFQEASHDYIHPELTKCIFLVRFKFEASPGNNVELLFMGEHASNVYRRSDRKTTKNTLMT